MESECIIDRESIGLCVCFAVITLPLRAGEEATDITSLRYGKRRVPERHRVSDAACEERRASVIGTAAWRTRLRGDHQNRTTCRLPNWSAHPAEAQVRRSRRHHSCYRNCNAFSSIAS